MSKMRRFRVEKLIRDRLPAIMREQGLATFERTLSDDEYDRALRDKLVEEAQELGGAKTRDEIQYELADVLEVMRALVQVHGLTMDDVETARTEKRERRGGFDDRVYNAAIEAPDGTPLCPITRRTRRSIRKSRR